MPSKTTTACVRLLLFFRIRRGTFPYGVEDEAITISLTPTTHYTNTCVKLTVVTHLSFSERIAIVLRKASVARVNRRLRPYYLIVRLLPNVFALAYRSFGFDIVRYGVTSRR